MANEWIGAFTNFSLTDGRMVTSTSDHWRENSGFDSFEATSSSRLLRRSFNSRTPNPWYERLCLVLFITAIFKTSSSIWQKHHKKSDISITFQKLIPPHPDFMKSQSVEEPCRVTLHQRSQSVSLLIPLCKTSYNLPVNLKLSFR